MARRKKSDTTEETVANEEHTSTGGIPEEHPQSEPDVFDQQIARAAEHAAEHFEQEAHHVQPMTAEQIVKDVADSTHMPEEAPNRAFAEKARNPDPHDFHTVRFPDGYGISFQESPSRKTVEIQFGDGSKKDQPQAFEAIKPYLRDQGMHWNGECAWVIDLHQPPKSRRESYAEREDRIEANKAIRTRVEDIVFPAAVAMEEDKRGQIDLSGGFRERAQKAAEGNAR